MPVQKKGINVPKYEVLSVTVTTAVGSEPALYRAVDATGAYSATPLGVVTNSREGAATVCVEGIVPLMLAAAQTLAVGASVKTNAQGYGLALTGSGTEVVVGTALDAVTTSVLGDVIQVKLKV